MTAINRPPIGRKRLPPGVRAHRAAVEEASARSGGAFEYLQIILLGTSLLAPFDLTFYGFGRELEAMSFGSLGFLVLTILLSAHTRTSEKIKIAIIALGLLFIAVFYSVLFTLNTGYDNPIPSMLSFRWQAYWLIFPCLVALSHRGVSLHKLLLTCALALSIALVFFVYRQWTWDLEEMAHNAWLEGRRAFIRAPDELRGYRLPDPQNAITALSNFVLMLLISSSKYRKFMLPFIAVIGLVYTESFQRVTIIYEVIALGIVYSLLSPRLANARPLIIFGIISIAILAPAILYDIAAEYVATDRSGSIRLNTINIAINQILRKPLFGFGLDSAQGVSYEAIFGENFFPQDIGYIGLTFTFGFLGIIGIAVAVLSIARSTLRSHGQPWGRHFLPLSFATLWTVVYLILGGVTLYPIMAPDGIVVFAILSALPYVLEFEYRRLPQPSEPTLRNTGDRSAVRTDSASRMPTKPTRGVFRG